MEKLFSYGTLQLETVQLETFGRLLTGNEDILPGYTLDEIQIQDKAVIATSGTDRHPILKYTGLSSDSVAGTVFEITEDELQQSDEYEVAEYQRVSAQLKSGVTAWIYADARSQTT